MSYLASRIGPQLRVRSQRGCGAEPQAAVAACEPDLSWREACGILHQELDRLPERHRVPLVLCYLDGLSRDEAATQLGRTLPSVKKSLERGQKLLAVDFKNEASRSPPACWRHSLAITPWPFHRARIRHTRCGPGKITTDNRHSSICNLEGHVDDWSRRGNLDRYRIS